MRGKRAETVDTLEEVRRAIPVITLGLTIVALILAAVAMDTSREAREAAKAERPAVIFTVEQEPTATLLAGDAWEFAALYRAAEDPAEKQRIGEALEAQGYFSVAVPLSWEYQDYMRTYCHLYGCPYPLALAVADWETRGQFNMDAIGPAGEVGIMQLSPGPDGSYHAELEAATGLDPTTPEGNIAGGCYKLGTFMAKYQDQATTEMSGTGDHHLWLDMPLFSVFPCDLIDPHPRNELRDLFSHLRRV